MHADLVKLLALQSKDTAVADVERRLKELDAEVGVLDRAIQRARDALDSARRAAADGVRRRDELEAKVESYRVLQDRRVQRLETVRNIRDFDQMFARGEPSVTLARVIAIRTRLIQTRSSYLDGLLELSQARADLAAAVGDPTLALPLAAQAVAAPEPK